MPEYVWGRNPILETLRSPRQVKRILIAKGQRDAPALATIFHEAERRHIPIEMLPRERLDELSQGAVHQGFITVVEARTNATLRQILYDPHPNNEHPFLLLLDPLQAIT